ncbi:uncharacterized protein LOC135388267 [Ornithodoros turicata]|uniref:uncharacterized protein LOC135388267 n=1 Tax=Ornithodoros turicata TaxID=34597 RepID=UPI00313971A1
MPMVLHQRERIDGTMRFPETAPVGERTPRGVTRDMQLALKYGRPVNGIKGPSALVNLLHYDVVWGQSVDYMHCVLLGVTKHLTEIVLSSVSQGSVNSAHQVINNRLLNIKPPHCFTRLPRSLEERSFWKASEWRHWLLFYCLPCTLGVIPQQHWLQLRRLAEAVHVLLLRNLTHCSAVSSKLQHAGKLWTFPNTAMWNA